MNDFNDGVMPLAPMVESLNGLRYEDETTNDGRLQVAIDGLIAQLTNVYTQYNVAGNYFRIRATAKALCKFGGGGICLDVYSGNIEGSFNVQTVDLIAEVEFNVTMSFLSDRLIRKQGAGYHVRPLQPLYEPGLP
jgi:hypothetical protein